MQKITYFLLLGLIFQSCHVGRYVTRLNANITDHKIFPYTEINTANEKFIFEKQETLQNHFTVKKKSGEELPLHQFLKNETTTTAFLVLQGDQIIFENYYKGYQSDDISNIFSASKSITSLLVGIAVDEGKIESIDDPVTKYITELKDADPNYQQLTIHHLLDMRSGLNFKEAYLNPFAHVARLYYGKNQLKQLKKLGFEETPGTTHNYQSVSTVILGMIVERATGMELGKYLEQKVWMPMGMEYRATWSVDDKKNRSTKAFCCLNTTARDLAKIGKLYLQDGNWNGQQIVHQDWVAASKNANLNNDCYQYQWYSPSGIGYDNGKELIYPDSLSAIAGAKEVGHRQFYVDKKSNDKDWHIHFCKEDFYALGILGQYLYVNPENDLIMVRLGEKSDANYYKVFQQIIRKVEADKETLSTD